MKNNSFQFIRATRGEDNVKCKCQLFLENVTTALDKDIQVLLYNNITPRRVAVWQATHTQYNRPNHGEVEVLYKE